MSENEYSENDVPFTLGKECFEQLGEQQFSCSFLSAWAPVQVEEPHYFTGDDAAIPGRNAGTGKQDNDRLAGKHWAPHAAILSACLLALV